MKKILVLGAVIIVVMTIALLVIEPKETQAPLLEGDSTKSNNSPDGEMSTSTITDNTDNAPDTSNTPPNPTKSSFGSIIEMKIGDIITFNNGLMVTLKNINDSRCKPDVQCIWIGELAPVLEISEDMTSTSTQEIVLGTERMKVATSTNHTFTLNNATETQIELKVTK